MKIKKVLTGVLLVSTVAGLGAIVACSSDSSSSSSSGSTTGGTVTVHVSAANGGTVSDPGGKASLAIPPGALAKDTDITLNVGSAANGSAGDVLDFGPDGLQFLKPATLTVKADGVTVPTGKTVSVAIFDGTAWKPLDGSTFANGVATASVMHFTKYSIVIIDGQVVLQPPSTCSDALSTFQACGGDPTGTWKFADFCIDPKTIGSDPFNGTCPQFAATADITWDATITFSGGATGSVTSSNGTQNITLGETFPLSCATAGSDGGVAACSDLTNASKNTTCTDTGGGNCSCTASKTQQTTGNTNAYSTSGNTLTINDGNGTVGDYCVKGGLLYFKETAGNSKGLLYVMQKQ